LPLMLSQYRSKYRFVFLLKGHRIYKSKKVIES
jgi:hypothetical protein